eukprot:TRINITY_DN108332_c0_g1_i1.p1 TRINITY_DN108332_c0_g1~~TRINITY_DN108332_c0_g1_i1.p1  ORF type:complete len:162 (+),score=28.88 TRINITY_DN108332_c0_g1_i1:87-572(+)
MAAEWKRRLAWAEDLLGPTLLSKEGPVNTLEAFKRKKVICLYFAARDSLPCMSFTPLLCDRYEEYPGNDVAVVFISSDGTQEAFNDTYSHMPWLALPYSERGKKIAVFEACYVGNRGIPCLTVLSQSDGTVQAANGYYCVQHSEDFASCLATWSAGPGLLG